MRGGLAVKANLSAGVSFTLAWEVFFVAAPSASVAHHRARIAGLSRDRAPNDPELVAAYSALRAARLHEQVVKIAPSLTRAQRQGIAAVLLDESRGGAA